MSNIYEAIYEKRANYDPFSSRDIIDCKTPLEDIFGAFLGEVIMTVTAGQVGWEKTFIYNPDIVKYRTSDYPNYSPHMILTTHALNELLGAPLKQLDTAAGGTDTGAANRIQTTFADVRLGLEGLVKVFTILLFSHRTYNITYLRTQIDPYDYHQVQNAPRDFQTVQRMSEAIKSVRNPSAHRELDKDATPMEVILRRSNAAVARIRRALPVMSNVFIHFSSQDAQRLEDRYLPLLDRILKDLDRKLQPSSIAPSATHVHYKDLTDYHIFLDESALAAGHTVTLDKLTDEMKVYIYADSISSAAKATANPDAMTKYVAKSALSSIQMSKHNVVRLENRAENDQQSILQTLRRNPEKKFFVITQSRNFATEILALGNPNHLAARTCNNRGEFAIYRGEESDA